MSLCLLNDPLFQTSPQPQLPFPLEYILIQVYVNGRTGSQDGNEADMEATSSGSNAAGDHAKSSNGGGDIEEKKKKKKKKRNSTENLNEISKLFKLALKGAYWISYWTFLYCSSFSYCFSYPTLQ